MAPVGCVAVLCHVHPSLSKGGSEIAAYTLFRNLVALGVDAIFVVPCAAQDRARLALGSPREIAVFDDPGHYDPFYHLAPPSMGRAVLECLQARSVQVASFHHFLNFGIGSLRRVAEAGIDVWLTLHEYLAICHHHGQMITRPAHALCHAASPERCSACFPERSRGQFGLRRDNFLEIFGGLAGFVSPSRFLAQRFAAWGLPGERIHLIENGIDGPTVSRDGSRRGCVFGFFGQMNPFKGIDTLLRAADRIGRSELGRRIELRLHGAPVGQSEDFQERLRGAAARHRFLRVSGAYENADVGRLMAECDYVVVPSRWWENSPVVIQEAFAAGCPVICSGIGGMAEKVADGVSGLHVRAGDAGDLVRALGEAAEPGVLARLRQGLPKVMDGAEMARRYLDAFSGQAPIEP